MTIIKELGYKIDEKQNNAHQNIENTYQPSDMTTEGLIKKHKKYVQPLI